MAPHPAAHCQALVLVVLVVVLVLNLLWLPVRCLCGKPPPPHAEDANAAGGFLAGLRGQTGEQSCDNTVARQFAAMVETGACLPAARRTWPARRTRVAVPPVARWAPSQRGCWCFLYCLAGGGMSQEEAAAYMAARNAEARKAAGAAPVQQQPPAI